MATLPSSPFGATTLNLPGSADVNAATRTAGMSFAKLIETTGLAVAESQRQLNQVGADSTTALAGQMVDVIAVQMNHYDESGHLVKNGTESIPMKLPLINFIDPVFYEWNQVRLQGQFFATELRDSSEVSSASSAVSTGVSNTGIGLLFGVGSHNFSASTSLASSDVDTSLDSSYGHIRSSALLQPKTDIGVPKPRQVIDAPSLGILVGEDVDDATEPGLRLKSISVIVYKRDGMPQDAGKRLPLSITADGGFWVYDPAPDTSGGITDEGGTIPLVLKRVLPVPAGQETPDPSPADVTVTVRMGVVSTTSVVRF